MHNAMLFLGVVHFPLPVFDGNDWMGGCHFEYGFDSDTTSTSVDLLGILVVSVDLETKSSGPQNLIGSGKRGLVVGRGKSITN